MALLVPEIGRRPGTAGDVPEGDLELSARVIVGVPVLIRLSLAAEVWAAHDGAVDIAVLHDTAIAAVRGKV